MKYKKSFHAFQQAYTTKYSNALRMRNYLPPLKNKSILDVGCGSGIDLAYFATQKPKKLVGSDISIELVAIAKENVPQAEVRNDSFLYLSQKDAVFDVVWSKYALNCSYDITTPLKEIYRVLKNNGVALLQVTHPFRTVQFLETKDYFDQKTAINYPAGKDQVFIEPHHTVSSWINAIHEAGFYITLCEEILNRPKEEYSGTITPSAIIFILKKHETTI